MLQLFEVKTDSGFIYVRAESIEAAMAWARKPLAQGGGDFSGVSGARPATSQVGDTRDGAGIYTVYPDNYAVEDLRGRGERIGVINSMGDRALQAQLIDNLIYLANNVAGQDGAQLGPKSWENHVRSDNRYYEARNQPVTRCYDGRVKVVGEENKLDPGDVRDPLLDDPSMVDPIQGFLQGLGFAPSQYGGPSASANFLNRQGALGAAAHYGQNVADYFGQLPSIQEQWRETGTPHEGFAGAHTPYQFGQQLNIQNPISSGAALMDAGPAALRALAQLSNIGQGPSVTDNPVQAEMNRYRGFVNPVTRDELNANRNNIANLLTASMQGAGMSPMYAPQVYGSDIDRLWTQYAAANPDLVGGFPTDQDTNFLNFAAGKFGLNRFFPALS